MGVEREKGRERLEEREIEEVMVMVGWN